LPYGFETQNPALQLSNDGGKFIIGFVGRLDIYTKGLDLLIKAFEHLPKKYHKLSFGFWVIATKELL
jgi:glycosyltransferase involved in cell wall biosynthesis